MELFKNNKGAGPPHIQLNEVREYQDQITEGPTPNLGAVLLFSLPRFEISRFRSERLGRRPLQIFIKYLNKARGLE
jgi:hypothetical protein